MGTARFKGQAALEYLMTYGWAILAVVAVIAALAYMGVFTPKPASSCVFDLPFHCIGGVAYVNQTTLRIVVSVDEARVSGNAQITSLTINGHSINLSNCNNYNAISPGVQTEVTCNLAGLTLNKGASFKGKITFQYTDKVNNVRTASGQFTGTVE